ALSYPHHRCARGRPAVNLRYPEPVPGDAPLPGVSNRARAALYSGSDLDGDRVSAEHSPQPGGSNPAPPRSAPPSAARRGIGEGAQGHQGAHSVAGNAATSRRACVRWNPARQQL
ncbi:MAG: hypothetical protein AVDCRST_MAG26-1794, partial [uncultured Chloroflexia bacterium]